MSAINIRTAKRQGVRLVFGFAGVSGSGKTYTALQFAYGLANYNSSKVGLLDAENRRGSLYSEDLKNEKGEVQPFLVGDLEPPFSPRRYTDAIKQFQEAGVDVLVVDSVSHEWEGTGGCEEIAHAQNPRMPDWKTAKREHKAFMNAALQSNMHIVFCIRAREKVKMSTVGGKTVVESMGIQPICEKNFMFEMTASLMMWDEGKKQDIAKCPQELRAHLGRGVDYITAKDGKAIREWVDAGGQLDPAVERARNTLKTTCEQGLAAVQAEFAKLPVKIKKELKEDGTIEMLKTSAAAYDALRVAGKPGGADLNDLNDRVLGDGE